jgi:hypothetical protein
MSAWSREIIGDPECPLLHRWTLLDVGSAKLLLHHFLPTKRDRDPHDHPRSFLTFVFLGRYDDEQPSGIIDRVQAPAVRFRRAEHAHITVAGPRGAWSLVVMGPKRRDWGFLRDGHWWPWSRYEDRFGTSFRCDEPVGEADNGPTGKYEALLDIAEKARQYLDTGRGDLDGALARLDALRQTPPDGDE